MSSRFILVLALMFLIGGAVVLWLKPPNPAPPPAIPAQTSPLPKAPAGAPKQFLVLAASWEPAFCEGAPDKPECQSLGSKRFDASHFALHGLWPDDEYCGVSSTQVERDKAGRWSQLPPVELDIATRAALDEAMPGTRSQLERHEWLKHGTCYRDKAGPYFATAILMLATLNGSPVRDLFAGSVGKELSGTRIRAAFDTAFGKGAGDRVRIACKDDGDRRLITELTIGLYGAPGETLNLGNLMLAANPTDPGCSKGIVDPTGRQ